MEYVTCNPHALSKEHYLAKEYVMNEKNQFIFKRSMAVMGEVSNLLIAFFFFFKLKTSRSIAFRYSVAAVWTPQGHGLLPGDLVGIIGEPASLLP